MPITEPGRFPIAGQAQAPEEAWSWPRIAPRGEGDLEVSGFELWRALRSSARRHHCARNRSGRVLELGSHRVQAELLRPYGSHRVQAELLRPYGSHRVQAELLRPYGSTILLFNRCTVIGISRFRSAFARAASSSASRTC